MANHRSQCIPVCVGADNAVWLLPIFISDNGLTALADTVQFMAWTILRRLKVQFLPETLPGRNCVTTKEQVKVIAEHACVEGESIHNMVADVTADQLLRCNPCC